jgi:MYXO-CTERM domain-containing protein
VLCTATCAGGSFACDSIGLPEGHHAVTARQADRAGNTGPIAAARSFTVDTVTPDVPVLSAPADGSSLATATPAAAGSCETGAIVEVVEASRVLCTTACTAGRYACTLPELADGPHRITASQQDAAGNRSAAATAVGFRVDTVPPPAATLDAPAAGQLLATASPAFEGRGEPGSTVTVWLDGAVACTTVVAADGGWSCASARAAADGRHAIQVGCRDGVGNETPPSDVTLVSIDTRAPGTPSLLVPAAGQATDAWTSFVGLAEPAADARVVVDGTVICSATADAAGRFACLASEALPPGDHRAHAIAVDEAGNESALSAPVSFVVAAGAVPGQPVLAAPAPGSVLATSTPEYRGLAAPGAAVSVAVDGVEVCVAPAGPTGEFACAPNHALADGGHVVVAVASNAAGAGRPSLDQPFRVDTVPPAAPVLVHPAAGGSTGLRPAVTGTAEPDSSIVVEVDGQTVCTAVTDGTGSFSCWPDRPLAPGPHEFGVTATDAAGHASPETAASVLVVDGKGPDVVVVEPAAGTVTNAAPVVFAGLAEPGSTVTVTLDGNEVCTAVAAPSSAWTCTATPADGRYRVEATAGNEHGAGAPWTGELVIDTVAPPAPSVASPADGATSGPWVDLRGTAEPGTATRVFVDGTPVCETTASAAGTFACAPPVPLAAGPHAAQAVSTDAAGNVSPPSAANRFTVSPTALALEAPSTDTPLADSTPTFSGTAEPGDRISVVVDGEVSCTATADATGTWSCTPSEALSEGAREVQVVADNGYGGVRTTAAATVVIDTVAPAAPILTWPAAGAALQGGDVAFAGTAEPDALVAVEVDGAGACSTRAARDGSWRCSAGVAAGSHRATATATDAAGNAGAASAPVLFDMTTELTAPTIVTPAAGSFLTDREVQFSGTAIPTTTVTVLDEEDRVLCAAEVDAAGAFACAGTARRGANQVHAISTWEDLMSPASPTVEFRVAGAGNFAGGGCSTGRGDASAWALVVLAGLVLRRRRARG